MDQIKLCYAAVKEDHCAFKMMQIQFIALARQLLSHPQTPFSWLQLLQEVCRIIQPKDDDNSELLEALTNEVEDRPLSDNENVHRCTPPILLSKREGNPCTLSSTISEESACSSQGIVRFLNRVFGNSNDVLSSPETSAKLDPDFDPLKLELDTSKDKDPAVISLCNKNLSREGNGIFSMPSLTSLYLKQEINANCEHEAQSDLQLNYDYDLFDENGAQENLNLLNISQNKRTHLGGKAIESQVCETNFISSSALSEHQRTHTEKKPFLCQVCNESFTDSGSLSKHQRLHTGAKPFESDVCTKTFNLEHSQSHHRRIHTGGKPFACKVCGKSFKFRGNLLIHQTTHSGEKLFECQVCEKSFTFRSGLFKHQRMHAGEKPSFECEICEKKFSSSSSLSRHRKRIHNGEKRFM
ncbi:zinc finger and SCAN domain-containing protein 31-like isoform X2 [Artemia franciscana]|uniref:zinc finger and SCAN domain-containing protein 31-like isoform X2 n=1 Tax=Artemia franciscana TaxID=6661 RepID=UPI0032DAAF65